MIANGYYDYTNTNPRNGYVSGTNHQNPSLIINGGTFAGGLNTIKNDDGAQLVINDGTFTNMSQATVQNHHVAEIKGGTFNTTGSAQYVVDNEGHNGAANDLGTDDYQWWNTEWQDLCGWCRCIAGCYRWYFFPIRPHFYT